MSYVEYDSNNSGGGWWLEDEDWYALEAAGWKVSWVKDNDSYDLRDGERFLGALATNATRTGLSLKDAIAEWEKVTGERASALGCSCCGTPHNFYEFSDSGSFLDSWSPTFPEYGDDFR